MTEPRAPLWKLLLSNVFLLSAAYLALGVVLELLRRYAPFNWPWRVLNAMDGLPTRTLHLLGLLEPVREAYGRGLMSTWQLRATFSLATLLVIALTAVAVGLLMALAQKLWDASRRRSA
ncbi:MAG TPA: hypothetical protein VK013_12725 [Myxococcaceae bacterium]|nr:hypothetical protein [Myxococcaceae bacterium]